MPFASPWPTASATQSSLPASCTTSPPPDHGLIELRRVTRRSARLAIFHPLGRAALAARHGSTLSDEDLLARRNLEPRLERHGWTLTSIDDGEDRYLAVAERT